MPVPPEVLYRAGISFLLYSLDGVIKRLPTLYQYKESNGKVIEEAQYGIDLSERDPAASCYIGIKPEESWMRIHAMTEIVTMDHIPTQVETDKFYPGTLVFVYDPTLIVPPSEPEPDGG